MTKSSDDDVTWRHPLKAKRDADTRIFVQYQLWAKIAENVKSRQQERSLWQQQQQQKHFNEENHSQKNGPWIQYRNKNTQFEA